jgi:threonine synthase
MYSLQCVSCSRKFDDSTLVYTCPDCGDIKGTLDIVYDQELIAQLKRQKNPFIDSHDSLFRYLPLLPLKPKISIPAMKIGRTPLYDFPKFAKKFGIANFFIKEDSHNPSLSCKDRASVIAILKACELGYKILTTASTGNAAASLACLAAYFGMECIIFIPESIPEEKLVQIRIHDAEVVLIKGNYDKAFEECRKNAEKNNWYNRSTAINPYNLEGKKTVALEICEQLKYDPPQYIFVPVGDGCIISGVWKGLQDLIRIKQIERMPKLIACQTEGSCSIYQSYHRGLQAPIKVTASTLADSISVSLPKDGVKALRAIRESNGDAITVTDKELLQALKELSSQYGIFTEPSSAVAFAAFKKYHKSEKLLATDSVVILLTGSGLKDQKTASEALRVSF